MTIVDRPTTLSAPAPAVWEAVKTPHAFRFITRGILTMPAIRDRDLPWQEGETVIGWVILFGLVPFSKHRRRNLHASDRPVRPLVLIHAATPMACLG
ncbi:MAG: hypothetical protein ACO3YU_02795 [Candidatus Nanopelagicales bacterium]